ncbi:hypothetical protein P152DRAFT_291702 [Eremomyces bilateralis CBS 781.70]|uniref:Rhodopsin domain-containing protein n=1 Tax=Eremomyces bilateralis CBS 781.70 TaxID=1392243 RepID=A0A6G1G7E9_9PEZI|nr:uncharacterized protein P152DRAFT_291702 [Eremomyces bilateralis CBS 781.70]KAF1813769.1 hypothetical protein P152DRAFT_291702 [Eremomyces bilateralis CBS 781.70]
MEAAAGCQAQGCTVKETLTSTRATMAACGVKPRDQSDIVIAIPASFGSVAILMILVRLVDRLWVRKISLGWDDHLVVIAMILALPLNGLCFPMARGLGKELWAIEFGTLRKTFQYLLFAEIFYVSSEMFVQLSFLAFYLRVFKIPVYRKVTYGLMVLVICFGVTNTFAMIFQCTPISFFWESWAAETTGTCIDINIYAWFRSGTEIGIDVAILSVPIPQLLELQMSWKKKIQVLSVFSVGFLITLVSILRLQALIQFSKTTNPTYDNAPAIYWSILETDMFIICANMPAMRSFLSAVRPSWFSSTENSNPPRSTGYLSHDKLGSHGQYRRQPSDGHQSDVELVGSLSEGNTSKVYV